MLMKAPQQNNLAIPMLSFYNILKCKGNGSIVWNDTEEQKGSGE